MLVFFLQKSVIPVLFFAEIRNFGMDWLINIDYSYFLRPERVFLLFTANFASQEDENQFYLLPADTDLCSKG
jgi:hypothetical protein